MCSLGDDDNIEEEEASKFMPESQQFDLIDERCIKCKKNAPNIVLRHKDVYCKECFLAATTHKFKALLGKHRFIHADNNVLMCHKGGHPSTALLHFIRSGLDLSTPKKLRFNPIILYIDKNSPDLDYRDKVIHDIYKEVSKFNFKMYVISLNEYILNPKNIKELLKEDTDEIIFEDASLNIVMKDGCTLTNTTEFFKTFERKLLLDAAKVLDCKCVFTTELAIEIASQLLTNVSLGRGIHIPLDTGVCDNRDSEVKIIRPMRYFEMKELAYYNHFNGLEPVMIKIVKENPYSSMQNLLKNFVGTLQSNFPATISTIVRTGDKLAMDETLKDNAKCLMCLAPTENTSVGLSSSESTNFSHCVSTQTPNYELQGPDRFQLILDSFNYSEKSQYCFACSRISHNLF